jgi:diadenosine tetraphosphate (Ap4A) HIT family hydrolase
MKILISIILNIFIVLPVLAQEHQDKHKRVEALKASFITQKLDLTPQESQNFWPIYNQYQKEISALYRMKRQNQFNKKNNPNATLNNDLDLDAKILGVKKSYQKEFAKVLPAEKVLALSQAEREFREQLIKELKERRDEKN